MFAIDQNTTKLSASKTETKSPSFCSKFIRTEFPVVLRVAVDVQNCTKVQILTQMPAAFGERQRRVIIATATCRMSFVLDL